MMLGTTKVLVQKTDRNHISHYRVSVFRFIQLCNFVMSKTNNLDEKDTLYNRFLQTSR